MGEKKTGNRVTGGVLLFGLALAAILAAVGTASNQDRLFAIFGAKMLDNAGSVHSALFDDKLRLALFSVDRNAPPDYPELEQMQEFIARSHIGLQTTVAA